MVYGIRATSQPVGAIVAYGEHAMLVVGYNTTIDPFTDGSNSINGFYIIDPWYKHSYASGLPPAGAYPAAGFPYNSYITYSSWNSTYLLHNWDSRNGSNLYQGAGPFWIDPTTHQGYFMTVLRMSGSQAPSDHPLQSYGDWVYSQTA